MNLPRIKSAIKLYFILVSGSLRAKMQYKFDFIASSLIEAVMGAYDYFIVAVMLWRFDSVMGWDIFEVGLLYAVSRIGFGLYRIFFNEVDQFERYIVSGEFDSLLLRPYPTFYVLISRNIDLARIAWVVQGAAIGAISIPNLMARGILSLSGVVHLVLSCLWTFGLFVAVGLATSSAAFYIVRIEELQVFTQNAPSSAALYPLDIYPGWLKWVLITVLPLGLGNYIPVRYLLGKGGTWLNLVMPAVGAAAALVIAYRLWLRGETRYHSTGS